MHFLPSPHEELQALEPVFVEAELFNYIATWRTVVQKYFFPWAYIVQKASVKWYMIHAARFTTE